MTEFHKASAKYEGGVKPRCKVCRKAETQDYLSRHRAEVYAANKAYAAANPEKCRARSAAYRGSHAEEIRAAKRAYHVANREKIIARVNQWVQANPEQRLRNAATYVKRHPEQRSETMRRYGAQRRAIIALSGPIDAALLRAKVAYWGDACWLCGGAWADIDHVKPLSKGGGHLLANLRPICKSCNRHKHARWPFSTARRVA